MVEIFEFPKSNEKLNFIEEVSTVGNLQLALPMGASEMKAAIIDDDEAIRYYFTEYLGSRGIKVKTFDNPDEFLDELTPYQDSDSPYDLVFSDMRMPKLTGIELTKKVHQYFPDIPIVLVTAYAEIEQAVEAIREGAYDYLEKPFTPNRLENVLRNSLNLRLLNIESKKYKERFVKTLKYGGVFCKSDSMQVVYELLSRVAKTDNSVLISGEDGVGKELIAKAVHDNSHRSKKPFIKVDCSTVSESLLESVLFGHVKKTISEASSNGVGLFTAAEGGTLFLDKVGDLNPLFQAKLAKVIKDKKIRPIGSKQDVKIDVRIVASTHQNIELRVSEKRFREDLYYLLSRVPIRIPPLRQREDDITIIANHILRKSALREDKKIKGFTVKAIEKLKSLPLNGNVRELKEIIQRSVMLSESKWIDEDDIPVHEENEFVKEMTDRQPSLKELEDRYIRSVLEEFDGTEQKAASYLGLSRKVLARRIQQMSQPDENSE